MHNNMHIYALQLGTISLFEALEDSIENDELITVIQNLLDGPGPIQSWMTVMVLLHSYGTSGGTWVCVTPRLAARSVLSGRERYWALWNRLSRC